MQCPVCSAELPNTAKFCGSCGTTLSPPPVPPQPAFQPPQPAFEQKEPAMNSSPSYGFPSNVPQAVKKKYKVLRLIAVLMKILSVIAGVALIITGLVMIVAGAASSSRTTATTPTFGEPGPAAFFGGLVGGLVLVVYGVFVFVFLYAYAEWMYVFMDIEENTRLTNEMLSARK